MNIQSYKSCFIVKTPLRSVRTSFKEESHKDENLPAILGDAFPLPENPSDQWLLYFEMLFELIGLKVQKENTREALGCIFYNEYRNFNVGSDFNDELRESFIRNMEEMIVNGIPRRNLQPILDNEIPSVIAITICSVLPGCKNADKAYDKLANVLNNENITSRISQGERQKLVDLLQERRSYMEAMNKEEEKKGADVLERLIAYNQIAYNQKMLEK